MEIEADRDACVGAGQCVLVAEELFDQDEDGLVLVLAPEPGATALPLARRAASLCPARAITVSDTTPADPPADPPAGPAAAG